MINLDESMGPGSGPLEIFCHRMDAKIICDFAHTGIYFKQMYKLYLIKYLSFL